MYYFKMENVNYVILVQPVLKGLILRKFYYIILSGMDVRDFHEYED